MTALLQTSEALSKDLLTFFGFFAAVALFALFVSVVLDGK